MRKLSITFSMTLALVSTIPGYSATSSEWKELARHALGGVGGWDLFAVDATSRRLFITRGEHLMVVDVDSGKLLGDVAGLHRAHGVALVPEKKRGYVSSGEDNRVVAFDLETLKVTEDISVTGKNPDAMLFDEASKHVFVFNGRSNDADVIDPATGKIVATMPIPGKPELAVSDGHGKIFVNLEDKNQVAQADSKAAKVTTTWSLGTCEEPTGLAIDTLHHRLFSVCANKQMVILSSEDGHVVATVAIGEGPDGATFDPQSATAFSSNSDGTLTVVHEDDPDHYHVVANVATPPRSRAIALDTKTHRVVLATAEFGPTPAPTTQQPHPRPSMNPDSFGILVVGRK